MRTLFSFALLWSAGSAMADAPRVAADITPVHGLVARVMNGVDEPARVISPTAAVHGHDLRPSEAAALDEADVVFWVGEAMTPWLARSIETLAADATVIALLEVEGTELMGFREEPGHDDDHDHDHDHDGSVDPHAWLDPANAVLWLDVIAGTLAEVDPTNADQYRANAKAGQAEIVDGVEAAEATLKDAGAIRYAVFHDAYQYFEAHFGLKPVGAVTLGDAAKPGPQRIARIRDQLLESGSKCLLVEPQENSALLSSLTATEDLKVVEIDPLGTDIGPEPGYYSGLLASLAASFAACR